MISVIGHYVVVILAVLLLMPVYANAQTSERISLLDNFGEYERGEQLFIFGNVALVDPNSYLILQIINPNGDLCQIQQLTSLSNGKFITEPIPLKGTLCGVVGDYEVKIFYGDNSKTTSFSVNSQIYSEPTITELVNSGFQLVSEKIVSVNEKSNANTLIYSERLEETKNKSPNGAILELEQLFVDLWIDFFIEEDLFDLDPIFNPAITASLDSTAQLVESGKLSFDLARDIDRETFSAIFYNEIGDSKNAIEILNDNFVSIKNVDPIKIEIKKELTFSELEETILNMMKKTNSVMSRIVKEELAFIFSRGTAPLYISELNDLLDLLTKARFLDVISRNEDPLYRIVQTEWDSLKSSMIKKESIEELIESQEKVAKAHKAALILRDLDNVDRFISSDQEENSELANLLLPNWEDLASDLELANSINDIIDSENEIRNLKNAVEVSSRITKAVEISRTINADTKLIEEWESLLSEVKDADSIPDIISLVSAFDNSINELRNKRNPISSLKLNYESMKAKAELQADYNNLFLINNALKILETAQKMEDGNPSVSRIDRIEVLLTWVSEKAPEIKSDLDSFSGDVYKIRASDILQRAQSIENLAELGLRKNRFLPGYIEFTESMNERLEQARNLVIKNDLDGADLLVRELFSEWRDVSLAYDEDPHGSEVGYNKDELKRIEYREKLESLSNFVTIFYNADFATHAAEYNTLTKEVYDLIDYGNFIDVDEKITELGNFVGDNLGQNNPSIIFEIFYDLEQGFWVLSGFVDKDNFDRRDRLQTTIYNMDGSQLSTLKFWNTKHGKFFTQWEAPVEPGLYVVELQYHEAKSSRLVNIEERIERVFSSEDLDITELSRDFDELRTFVEKFGGKNYGENDSRFTPIFNDITRNLADRNEENVDQKLLELKRMIERYLPQRSREAVIETNYENNILYLSGAVQKTLSFSEDLYVDIFDQQGNRIKEISLKDTSSGKFNEIISEPFLPGTYVAQLQYHDLIVSDFFSVFN